MKGIKINEMLKRIFILVNQLFAIGIKLIVGTHRLLASVIAEYYSVSSFISRMVAIVIVVVVILSGVSIYYIHSDFFSIHVIFFNWIMVLINLFTAIHCVMVGHYKTSIMFSILGIAGIFTLSLILSMACYFLLRFYITVEVTKELSVKHSDDDSDDDSDDSGTSGS